MEQKKDGVESYISQILDECARTLGKLAGGAEASKAEAQIKDAGLDLTIQAMAVMCVADGRVDPAEINTKAEFYERETERRIDEQTIRAAVALVSRQKQTFWETVGAKAKQLPLAIRENILRAAGGIAAADGALHETEIATLQQLAHAMDISRDTYDHIVRELAKPEN